MLDFIVTLYGINTILVGFCLHELYKIRRLKEDMLNVPTVEAEVADETAEESADVPEQDTQALTESEILRLEREHEFDLRISQMKEELASRLPERPVSEPAMQLHPHVHNLPHNIIADYYDDLPDVEITQ